MIDNLAKNHDAAYDTSPSGEVLTPIKYNFFYKLPGFSHRSSVRHPLCLLYEVLAYSKYKNTLEMLDFSTLYKKNCKNTRFP